MNSNTAKLMLVVALVFVGGMLPCASASEWDQKTIFTFSGPVEVQGQVLDARTYVFNSADSASDRNIVQVFSKNEKRP